ncbi:hypothetical protein PYCCODRAFT_918926 [Trametes coccinea BRFM310]|uniref:Uncharacterized protein n=1 Tax=Trametes coccinea (strain BRFM310) TaxID=1353009 RepID=A0A1Y2IYR0_TRAC3|nr:hypothetical protein PYCCODRAFT_918926 [Trametes coccinea BRFM310]
MRSSLLVLAVLSSRCRLPIVFITTPLPVFLSRICVLDASPPLSDSMISPVSILCLSIVWTLSSTLPSQNQTRYSLSFLPLHRLSHPPPNGAANVFGLGLVYTDDPHTRKSSHSPNVSIWRRRRRAAAAFAHEVTHPGFPPSQGRLRRPKSRAELMRLHSACGCPIQEQSEWPVLPQPSCASTLITPQPASPPHGLARCCL